MKTKLGIILGIITLMVFINAGLALSEDQVDAKPDASLTVVPQEKIDADTQWVWGEVIGVDTQNKTVTLKYLDYEADKENDIVITVDSSTTYENAKSLDEIKAQDTLSVDYLPSNGKNIAKNISLEKPETGAETSENPKPSAQAENPDNSNSHPVQLDTAVGVEKSETTTQVPQAKQ